MFKKKEEIEKKDVEAEDLMKIISHNANDHLVLEERLNKFSFSEDPIYGLESHIRHIKAEAKDLGLEKHIFVENLEGSTFVKEAGFEIPYRYKVTVSNLNISLSTVKVPKIFMHDLHVLGAVPASNKSSDWGLYGMLYFEFKDNTINNAVPGFLNYIDVYLGQSATLSFIGNHFKNVDVVVRVDKAGTSASVVRTKVAVLEFKNNVSEIPISIGRCSSKEKFPVVADSWRLKRGIRGQIYAANKIENPINEYILEEKKESLEKLGIYLKKHNLPEKITQEERSLCAAVSAKVRATAYEHNKIKVTPEQIEEVDDKCIIRMSDNKFDELVIFGMTNFYFEGRNVIKQLIPYVADDPEVVPGKISIEAFIHWGAGQNLDEDGKYFFPHKKIFTTLKQRAIANGDTMQEIILQREISRCDHAIAKSEKVSFPCKNLNVWENFKSCKNLETWKNLKACMNLETRENLKAWLGVWEDIIIFGFSKWISNYGTSWIRPFRLLVVFNVLTVVLVYITAELGDNSSVGAIFFELFNPTSYLPKMLNPKILNPDPNAWISFLFISQKIILAFTLYEMIKIFRRFGRR